MPSSEPCPQRPQGQQQQPVLVPQLAQQCQPQPPGQAANQPADLQQAIPRVPQELPPPVSPNQEPAPGKHSFVTAIAANFGTSGQQQVPLTELLQFIAKMSADSPAKLRETIQGYRAAKASISDDEATLHAISDQSVTASEELRSLGARYDELALLTPLEQRDDLSAVKASVIAAKSKDLNALRTRHLQCFCAFEKKAAELRGFEEWVKAFCALAPDALKAFEECLRELSDLEG
jgi:hypothetical protein